MNNQQINPSELRRWLRQHINMEELSTLCKMLNIRDDSWSHMGLDGQIIAFLRYLIPQARLTELITVGKSLRPDLDWDTRQPQPATAPPPPVQQQPPPPEAYADLQIESTKATATINLDYNFGQLRAFMQDAFRLEELLQFIENSATFRGLTFSLPRNASHQRVTMELFDWARRRGRLIALLEALEAQKPTLYDKHKPYIKEGRFTITVTTAVNGTEEQLKALARLDLSEESKADIIQLANQSILGEPS